MSRAASCMSWSTSRSLFTGAHGTFFAKSRCIHSRWGRPRNAVCSTASRSKRFLRRWPLLSNRGSRISLGTPSVWQIASQKCCCKPTTAIHSPSAHSNTLKGAECCDAAPRLSGCGRPRPTRGNSGVSIATQQSNMDMSTRAPSPVRRRCSSAACTPITAHMPPAMSASCTPRPVGGVPSWPVTDMRPDRACTTTSMAGKRASGPTWPYPDTEQ
mmetsp:Transcript_9272/g.19183  ORF Transcript_9272/g.19183 Transcript_9272/m.19183 type:complete len:214 (-) Transcript_9272:212-853(-)